MKLLNPFTYAPIALLSSWLAHVWLGNVEYRFISHNGGIIPRREGKTHAIYLLWHENLFVGSYPHAKKNMVPLISASRDGEWIARTMQFLGMQSVRGSSSRRGSTGLRKLIRIARKSNLAITPDGPRGPRRVVQAGAIYLASRTGSHIIPGGIAATRFTRVPSWDRMLLPMLGSKVFVVYGSPIAIPARIGTEELEKFRLRVQAALDETQAYTEAVASGNISSPPSMSWAQTVNSADSPSYHSP